MALMTGGTLLRQLASMSPRDTVDWGLVLHVQCIAGDVAVYRTQGDQ